MFKNLNEKDKKKIYSLLSLGVVCAIALIVMPSFSKKESEEEKKTSVDNQAQVEQTNNNSSLERKLKIYYLRLRELENWM